MKINWQPNPLHTTVDLDERDRQVLRLKIKIERLTDLLGEAAFHIKEGEHYDLSRVREAVAYETWCADDDEPEHDFNKEVERFLSYAVDELTTGVHCGDCTCVPCSCTKCWAEDLLGINTIKGAGKHSLYKIDAAFGDKDGSVTIDEAIRSLENYAPTRNEAWIKSDPTGERWEACLPRWRTEAAHAVEWLKKYRDEHFASEPV